MAYPPLETYIEQTWHALQRSGRHLAQAAIDPKLGERENFPVYLSSRENLDAVKARLRREGGESALLGIEWRVLPDEVVTSPHLSSSLATHGLLYLPHPYIVPGGRFNEMYGWDSYFINRGLLLSGHLGSAKAMVDNHLYQVEHYGRVLNANRTYYLTRSQPPFLASMVADVYRFTGDRAWLTQAWPALTSTYCYWTEPPHLTPETGLSRYLDLGHGPADEVEISERDAEGLSHYQRIQQEYARLAELPRDQQEALLGYPLAQVYDPVEDRLTDLFYLGDRSMRESGYDPSDRFGRFNVDVIHSNPVDLNSLLYAYELEMGRLAEELERPGEPWRAAARLRAERMRNLFWDEPAGQFFDYHWGRKERRKYPFATTYFPLWTGWASPEEAARLHRGLPAFLRAGGVLTSWHETGNQWDAPFGWAPLQLVAAEGLRRYGYQRAADTVARAFRDMVLAEYQRVGFVVEKYDVVRASADVSERIDFGYSSNEVGFGWTNAVYLLFDRWLASQRSVSLQG